MNTGMPFRYSSPPAEPEPETCAECDRPCARLIINGECCACRELDPTAFCNDCESERDRQAERAYERSIENYYGSSSPVTLDEQHAQAWKEKNS